MKKSLFYLISFIIFAIFFIFFQEFTFKYISKYFAEKKTYDFIKKYINETNHLRSHVDYSVCNENNKPQCLLFNKIENEKKKNIVLINGDSWAHTFVTINNEKKILTKFSKKNKIEFILAGTSSYSFSPMLSQLRILKRDWNIESDFIISIFDQTDIGDEICRYKDFRKINSSGDIIVNKFGKKYLNEVYNYSHFLQRHAIFYSNDLKFIKLVKLINLQIKKKDVSIFKLKCSFDVIQNYLIEPISDQDKVYIQNIINQYIEKVFQYKRIKKLLIVTHPHKQHFQGIYKTDIGDIIEEVVINSLYSDRIILINFTKNNLLNVNDFIVEDPASHLKTKSYPKYVNHILKILHEQIK